MKKNIINENELKTYCWKLHKKLGELKEEYKLPSYIKIIFGMPNSKTYNNCMFYREELIVYRNSLSWKEDIYNKYNEMVQLLDKEMFDYVQNHTNISMVFVLRPIQVIEIEDYIKEYYKIIFEGIVSFE